MNSLRPLRWQRLALPLLRRAVRASPAAPSFPTPTTSSSISTTRVTAVTTATGVRNMSMAAEKPATSELAKEEELDKESKEAGGPQPPAHGERLWVFHHITANMIVYSLTPQIYPTKAFRQFKYTGKKLVPAKFRKDYWRPLAVVELGAGLGDVGRSVYHKLRELKHRHELEWGGEEQSRELLGLSRRERGKALNDQRGNAVADLAAVLAGAGKGNRMVVDQEEGAGGRKGKKKKETVNGKTEAVAEAGGEGDKQTQTRTQAPPPQLHKVTVYWANEQDKFFAESWSDNVTHVVGLPDKPSKVEAEPPAAVEDAPAAAEAQ
ncbi:hypothetical protein VTK26DRAFT_615 [Humicola hyalothermophila]